MRIELVKAQQLNRLEEMGIAMSCKRNPEFVIVRHNHNTIYINAEHPKAAELESIINDALTADYLDGTTANGKAPLDLMDDFERLTNPDAGYHAYCIVCSEMDKRRKKRNEEQAARWSRENPLPDRDDIPGLDTDFLQALYNVVRQQEKDCAPAQQWAGEYATRQALTAVYYYGYQYGMNAAQTNQEAE